MRLSRKQTVAYLGIGVAFILLLLSGYWVLALCLFLLAVVGLLVYVLDLLHRLPAGRRVVVEETVRLPWTCDVVWDLIKPAEKAPVLGDDIRQGYKVPGTPDGLGEQQALGHHDGRTVIIEVVGYQPGRRAVTRQVSPHPDYWSRSIQAVDPIEGGCAYTRGVEVEMKAGRRIGPYVEKLLRSEFREHLSLVQQTLAAADQGPASAGNLSADQAPVWPSPKPPAQG